MKKKTSEVTRRSFLRCSLSAALVGSSVLLAQRSVMASSYSDHTDHQDFTGHLDAPHGDTPHYDDQGPHVDAPQFHWDFTDTAEFGGDSPHQDTVTHGDGNLHHDLPHGDNVHNDWSGHTDHQDHMDFTYGDNAPNE